MKKAIYIFIVVIILAGFAYVIQQQKVRGVIQNTLTAIQTPFKVAALYNQPADTYLAMPIKGIRVKDIADTWQAARSGGRAHEGQDIFAKSGTPIYSATHGFVINVGSSTLGGNTVMILGAGGYRYYYAHLSAYGADARVGNEVSTSSIIGYVGNTGDASTTPSHLHFGIYTNQGSINPLPLLVNG